jgi:subtilisin family serine protease
MSNRTTSPRNLALRAVAALAAAALVAVSSAPSSARQPATVEDAGQHAPQKPASSRLDSTLTRLAAAPMSAGPSWISAGAGAARAMGHDGKVAVTVRTNAGGSAVADMIESKGGLIAKRGEGYFEAYLPPSMLSEIDGRPDVVSVSAIVPPQPAVLSEGAVVHGALPWHAGGFDGAGVKVGVIDIGFIGFSGLMGTELPGAVTARCYQAIGQPTSELASCMTRDVHGTAVTEALFDVAPGAQYYLANPQSPGDLYDTVIWMAGQGVRVINHSVVWTWDGRGDGTSPYLNSPLAAVDLAATAGITWVNAAGNFGKKTFSGGFEDSDGDSAHEFGVTDGVPDEGNTVYLEAGQALVVQLRWGAQWGGAQRDLDLFLRRSATGELVALSAAHQDGEPGDVPFELISYLAPASGDYFITVTRYSGTEPGWLDLQVFAGPNLEWKSGRRSIANPAESANGAMLAVGAAPHFDTSDLEAYSSHGPTRDGRIKPDVVGADRGDSVTYGQNGFKGTSQAAPHVAGMAALVLQRWPQFAPADVTAYIKSTAQERGVPGPDVRWGYGFAALPAP